MFKTMAKKQCAAWSKRVDTKNVFCRHRVNAPTSDEYVKFEVKNDIVNKTLINKAASPSRSKEHLLS